MPFPPFRLWWLAPAVVVAGFVSGRLTAAPRTDDFDVTDWPSRGRGERLVEYFDPSCPASRAVHARLGELLRDRPSIEHVLVPVAIARGRRTPPADLLCALPPTDAWRVADTWADQAPDRSLEASIPPERLAACATRVEAATRHTATLADDRTPSAPVVELRGRAYHGTSGLAALELALGAHGGRP